MLVVLAFLILSLDLLSFRHRERVWRTRTLGSLVGLGLLAVMVPLCELTAREVGPLLRGSLVLDDLSVLFKMVIVILTILTALISSAHDVGEHVGEYFATLLFGAIGMMLLVSAEELITIFVALELTSLSLYILTAFHKDALRSQEAALKYFLFGALASAFLLFGLGYLVGLTGTTNLREMSQLTGVMTPLMGTGLLFVLVGLGFKVAVVPFHLWAPDAYEGAPTPVTAFIATASKVASFVVLVKVVWIGFLPAQGAANWGGFLPGWAMVLAVMATASMVWGNVAAIVQQNVKRLLAYSSIAHAGYILIGLVAATTSGVSAVLFYVIVYSLTNLGAFGVVAVLSGQLGGEELDRFDGLARRAPFLSFCLLVFLLSLAGIPPLAGFFGKFYLFAAALQQADGSFGLLWLVTVGILMSAVSLYYYLVLLKHVYVAAPADRTALPTPLYVKLVLGMVALLVVLLGVFPQPLLALLNALVTRL
ncbi:NADH-quinone oxidoreductase subunit N [bacterium]|nr:NADH-quinone oxidoreductase subunit N [bacterium]